MDLFEIVSIVVFVSQCLLFFDPTTAVLHQNLNLKVHLNNPFSQHSKERLVHMMLTWVHKKPH